MKKTIQVLILLFFAIPMFTQNFLSQSFYDNYNNYKEKNITVKRVTHEEITPLINKLKSNEIFTVKGLGNSLQ